MKIIIITRDGEYDGSSAMEHYSKETPREGRFITEYITNYFRKLLICDRALLRGMPITLISGSDFDEYDDEWYEKARSIEQSNGDYESYTQEYWNGKFEEIVCPKLEDLLALKDDAHRNCPYVRFTLGRKDVNFVFLNRIFDQFTDNDYHKYNLLIEKDRSGFIKAICQDCGILDEAGNLATTEGDNYLYIHDKEWGHIGTKTIKYETRWEEDITNSELKTLLEKCFSRIFVFQHNADTEHFKEIKDLTFLSNADELEEKILKRGYF